MPELIESPSRVEATSGSGRIALKSHVRSRRIADRSCWRVSTRASTGSCRSSGW